MSNTQELKCLFGFHNFVFYGSPITITACAICGLTHTNSGEEYWTRWNSAGNRLLYRKFASGEEEWYKYDEKGRLIHFRKSDGVNVEYDYPQGKIPKQKVYDGPCTELP